MDDLNVAAAVIWKDGRILISRRKPEDSMGGLWEFPGGKKEGKETLEECVVREVREELGVRIAVKAFLGTQENQRPSGGRLFLHFFLCELLEGEPSPIDCSEVLWVFPEQLKQYAFPRADRDILNHLSTWTDKSPRN